MGGMRGLALTCARARDCVCGVLFFFFIFSFIGGVGDFFFFLCFSFLNFSIVSIATIGKYC